MCCGGTDERAGGTVIDTPRLREAFVAPPTGVAAPDGDWPRGRLLRFSEPVVRMHEPRVTCSSYLGVRRPKPCAAL